MKYLSYALLSLVLVACGGGGSDTKVLHLAGQDITADAYRAHLRDQAALDPQGLQAICDLINGLGSAEAARVLANLSAGARPIVWAGATPKPGQSDNSADYETATGILQGECRR